MRGGHSPFKPRPRRSWRAPGELLNFSLFFICTMFLILSRIGHGAIEDARDGLVDLAAPLLEASSKPVIMARHAVMRVRSYVGAFEEIDRLKAENETLKQWEWRAKLAERNVSELRALLNAVDEPALNFVSGSVIADARGPFLRSVLINLGRDRGLRIGYAVINGDGLIGRTVDVGNYVNPGQALFAIVQDTMWVTANFKETQLADIHPGQSVDIRIDTVPATTFHGTVDSFQPGSGTEFSVLPAENATGNFVKIVQRLPVKIVFDDDRLKNYRISPGLSVEPSVRVR